MPELFDIDEPRQPRKLVLPALAVPDGRSTEARRQRKNRGVTERLRQANTRPKDLTTVRQRMALTPTGTPAYISLAREAEELERQAGQVAPGFGAVLDVPGEIGRGVVRAAAESPAAQAIGSFARGRPYEPRPPTFQPKTGAEAIGAMVPSFISPPYQSIEELAREPGWSQAAMALTPVISGAGATLPQVMANVRAGQYAAGRGLQRGAGAVGREIVRKSTPGPSGLVPGSPGFARVGKKPENLVTVANIDTQVKRLKEARKLVTHEEGIIRHDSIDEEIDLLTQLRGEVLESELGPEKWQHYIEAGEEWTEAKATVEGLEEVLGSSPLQRWYRRLVIRTGKNAGDVVSDSLLRKYNFNDYADLASELGYATRLNEGGRSGQKFEIAADEALKNDLRQMYRDYGKLGRAKADLRYLDAEMKELSKGAQPVAPEPVQTAGAMQAGMGFGEKASQGSLLGEFGGGGVAGLQGQKLIEPAPLLAKQARAAEVARGQGEMPLAAPPPSPIAAKVAPALPEAGPGQTGIGPPPVEPPKPPVAQAVPPPGEPPKLPTGVGGPGDTEDAMRRFARMVASPTNAEAAEAQRLAWGQEYARRLQNMGQRAKEMVDQGVASEEAAHKAMNELRGAYLRQFNQTDWITGEVRAAMYAKVNRVLGGDAARGILPDKDWPSTLQALDHALEGKIIPDKPGTAGGSAKTRLLRVFADEPEILAVVEQIVNKRKALKSLVDDTVLASKPPAPGLSEPYTYPFPWQGFWRERAEQGFWPQILTEQGSLRSMTHEEARQWWLSGFQEPKAYTIAGTPWERAEQTTLVPKMPLRGPQPETRSAEELKWIKTRLELGMPTEQPRMRPSELDVDVSKALLKEKKTPFESEAVQDLRLQIALKEDPPVWPKEAPLDSPVDDAFQAMPLITPPERSFIVRVLKEAGLTAMDIGNFIRANRSSVDQSWWRQAAPMIPRAIFDSKYRSNFWAANLRSWAATFSQNAAEESWTRILNHRLFPKYLEMADKGYDFLRHPRLMPGETAARAAEEFGYSAGAKRPIPRLTAALPWVKVSQRGYVTGLNEMTWRIFEQAAERVDDVIGQLARGKMKLPVGEALDPNRELEDVARFLSIMGGRGPMGRFRQAAPQISAGIWAPRLAVARLMQPSLLASRNKWVRAEAWKNLLSWASFLGSIMFAADQLGWADVELDPRSSDLGKLRIGPIRVDLTFGQAQYLVLASRLATGSMKSASTGEVTKRSREYILSRALRGKEAPVLGTLNTLAEGREFTGEKVDYSNPAFWARQVAPLAPTQAVEFAQKQGITKGLLAAPLAVVGIDVASYGMPAQWLPDYERYRSYPTLKAEAKSKKTLTRVEFRKKNPEIDAKLYLAGIVESLETKWARGLVVKLMQENKVNPKDVKGLQEKELESDERKKLRLWILRALGQSIPPQKQAPIAPDMEGQTPPSAPTVVPRLPPIYPQAGPQGKAYDQMMGIR